MHQRELPCNGKVSTFLVQGSPKCGTRIPEKGSDRNGRPQRIRACLHPARKQCELAVTHESRYLYKQCLGRYLSKRRLRSPSKSRAAGRTHTDHSSAAAHSLFA
ncbi:hypothetical protein CEXT_138601 [Caerostris extrusa]|uniref:Uncharacterized protein n=1 Tax=Caerostris extrusa TaxID=172846 RepID=A0AAV4VQW1_CAEEX|nr:hypothetical protein CEXT_138601 [Caerostris extrusa]